MNIVHEISLVASWAIIAISAIHLLSLIGSYNEFSKLSGLFWCLLLAALMNVFGLLNW